MEGALNTEPTLSLTENLCRSTPSVRAWLSGSDWLKEKKHYLLEVRSVKLYFNCSVYNHLDTLRKEL